MLESKTNRPRSEPVTKPAGYHPLKTPANHEKSKELMAVS